jgi:acetolactate synthase-1/2/3 large subunit
VNGAELTVEALVAEGVTDVFGLPGTTIMELIDTLGTRQGITYRSVRHEQAAAHMADGYWRASERLAVALASRGPGAANLAIGVHNACAESIPLLAMVGQVSDAIAHREAFEEIDLVSFFRPITKWALEVSDPERVAELTQRAARTALAGRPRPVLLSLPLNVLQAAVTAEPVASVPARMPPPAGLDDVIGALVDAERPVIVAGGGTLRTRFSDGLIAAAEAFGAPVVTTWMRKNAFPNRHPAFAGTLGYGAHASALRAVAEADLVVALGCRFSEFSTSRYSLVPETATVIQVDVDATQIGAVQPVDIGIVGDAWAVADLLAAEAAGSEAVSAARAGRVDRRAELHAEFEAQSVVPDQPAAGAGVASAAAARAIDEALRADPAMVIVQDTHSFGPWLSRHVTLDRPGSYYAAAGGAMGWGVPAALGVQVARPDARVMAVCGDGSFWMVAQEVETAVREQLPVVFVITNNFAFGNTRDRQRQAHGGRYLGVFYDNPDFARFAELLGAHGERVERDEQLAPALERAFASGRTAIVDVIQDRHEGLPADLTPPAAK